MANPLHVYFWMLGQDARLGLLTQAGFVRCGPALYRKGPLWLHQRGLALTEGLLYRRDGGRFYQVASDSIPPELPEQATPLPFRQGWAQLSPHLQDYEGWVNRVRPDYRKQLLRICPPALRSQRWQWKQRFLSPVPL